MELYHHGILGMKWGIRRYQNADGTLTEAGKKRYGADDAMSLTESGRRKMARDYARTANKMVREHSKSVSKYIKANYKANKQTDDYKYDKLIEKSDKLRKTAIDGKKLVEDFLKQGKKYGLPLESYSTTYSPTSSKIIAAASVLTYFGAIPYALIEGGRATKQERMYGGNSQNAIRTIKVVAHSELAHHGIKGQKWGIRNGPPYPIEDKVLKKGTRLNSVGTVKKSKKYANQGRWLYVYNPDDPKDAAIYKGPFSKYLKQRTYNDTVYEHQYEVVSDLKMPTSEERVRKFVELYNKNKEFVAGDLQNVKDHMVRNKFPFESAKLEEVMNTNLNALESSKDFKIAYEIFNHAMEANYATDTTRKYSRMMAREFDAMVDDNNVNIYNGAHDPIIIFRPEKVLKVISEAREVTMSEIDDNYKVIADELAKKGQLPKL